MFGLFASFGGSSNQQAASNQQPPLFEQMQEQQPFDIMLQQQQMPIPNVAAGGCCNHSTPLQTDRGVIKELALGTNLEDKNIVGMVVTMCSGSTYDGVFTSVEQKAGEGERVAVYSCSDIHPTQLLESLQIHEDNKGTLDKTTSHCCKDKMLSEMKSLEPCTVVFNWECCSGFSSDRFKEMNENDPTIALMAYLLERGYMVQCSDFSAGALIKCWDANLLGPNPLVKAGTFSDSVTLKFTSSSLKQNEDSAQLQMVGDLCEDTAVLHAMGGTVAFTVDEKVKAKKWEEVEVLTVAVRLGGKDAGSFGKPMCNTKSGLSGLAGHVIIRYPSGGRLLVGCPHWIELSNINVAEDQLLEVAEKRYGAAYRGQMESELAAAPMASAQRQEMCKNYGSKFVQQSAPQKYSKSSSFYS